LADSLFPFSVQQPQTPLFGSRELVVIPISATGVNMNSLNNMKNQAIGKRRAEHHLERECLLKNRRT
jgi:hypothetical protein